jgi:hypothetical protein
LSEDDNNISKHPIIFKYKLSKAGKIALVIAIVSLSIEIITIILSLLSITSGFLPIIMCIISLISTMIFGIFLVADILKYNKLNNIKEGNDNKMVIGLIIGIIIGLTWGKLL